MKIKELDGKAFFKAFEHGAKLVEKNKKHLNDINFFPVPDSDTGNNMSITLTSVAIKVEPDNSIYNTIEAISDYSIQSARGNSGLILAQFFSGLYKKMVNKATLNTREFARNVKKTIPYLYDNVDDPHEGTMITVIKDWGEKLPDLAENIDDFVLLFEKSLDVAKESLEETKHILEVHKKNNSVDAGAQGFIYFLEGIIYYWKNPDVTDDGAITEDELNEDDIASIDNNLDNMNEEDLNYRYCTEILLQTDLKNSVIKSELKAEGDSLIVASSKNNTRVHIHTNDPAKVAYILHDKGKIVEQKVDDMKFQVNINNGPKRDIALITDSIADIPQELIDKYEIHMIPLNMIIDGVSFLDRQTINLDYFFEYLEKADEFPSSSLPTADFIYNYMMKIKDRYNSMLVISVAEELSGTGKAFKQAITKLQSEVDLPVSYIDSRLNSGAQGLLVLKAAEEIEKGKSLDEIEKIIKEYRGKAKIYVNVNTFDYMVKGGRVSPMKGFVANLLNFKPIVSLDETGKGTIKGKSLTRKGVSKKIEDIVVNINNEEPIEKYCIIHSKADELAAEWKEEITELLGFGPEYIMNISSVTALNAGPGSVALSLISK
ncbi:DegV family EDD domain-containing protein [Halanaerobiaceae bacterium Z-7014]|uniref:DegV family EDD domain-containing protein n=1 Tax=Halonatronomonas betaini TaxID=2778430 RepID=A0A931F665_9FIRM|nr:DegV family protein [Halonatronomonas betaini]MBF8436585.1 DegV family EDD domain-containing protein [Halonatronomonas betaini]